LLGTGGDIFELGLSQALGTAKKVALTLLNIFID